jgi:1-deoxy-D-xylulose-5-phosphate synthase
VLNRVSRHGDICPNLGFTSYRSLALWVRCPRRQIVFDCHTRATRTRSTPSQRRFSRRQCHGPHSGYSSPTENPEYDNFEIGHTSTSVALASGLQKARDLLHQHYNVIAVLGDGSLSGGEAFEGIATAAETGTNFILVFNDNEMSYRREPRWTLPRTGRAAPNGRQGNRQSVSRHGLRLHVCGKGNDISSTCQCHQ